MAGLLWLIVVALVAFWVIGLVVHIAGGLIHLLLVAAIILVIANVVMGMRGSRDTTSTL